MIDLPYSLSFDANRKKYGNGTNPPCCVCAKPIADMDRAHWIHIHDGGGLVVTEEEAATMDPGADLGCQPVGSGCWRKFPQLHEYEV